MKLITNDIKKMTIILDDNDIVEIVSLKGNNEKLVITCIDSTLHIDEFTIKNIKDMQNEAEAIEAMKAHLVEVDEE